MALLLARRMSLGKAVNCTVPQFPHLASGGEDATFLKGYRWGLSGIIQRAGPRLLGLTLSERCPSVLLPAGLSKDHAHPREPRLQTYLSPQTSDSHCPTHCLVLEFSGYPPLQWP